jgi:hypothetical protein
MLGGTDIEVQEAVATMAQELDELRDEVARLRAELAALRQPMVSPTTGCLGAQVAQRGTVFHTGY